MSHRPIDATGAGERVLKRLKSGYKIVGKEYIKPWYSWAALGITTGMLLGAIYVVNSHGQFAYTEAQQSPQSQSIATRTITFASDGNERVGVFIPKIERIDDDSSLLSVATKVIGVALWVFGVPSPLELLGEAVAGAAGATVGSVVGAVQSFFAEPVVQVLVQASSFVPPSSGSVQAGPQQTITGAIGGPIVKAGKAARGTTVSTPAVSSQKAVADAIKSVEKILTKSIKRLPGLAALRQKAILTSISDEAAKLMRLAKKSDNELLAIYKTELMRDAAINGIGRAVSFYIKNAPKEEPSYSDGAYMVSEADQGIIRIATETKKVLNIIYKNSLGVTNSTAAQFGDVDKDHYLLYEGMRKTAVILPGKVKPWEATLPQSNWIGYRERIDEPGRGPRKYTIMGAVETVTLTQVPLEARLAILSTDKQIEVRINGIQVFMGDPKKNAKVNPADGGIVLDIAQFLGVGNNKIAVYTVHSTDKGQRFGLNFAGYATVPAN